MRFIEQLALAATALYPFIEPLFFHVAHEWAPLAGSVAVTELIDATISYLTIGPGTGNTTTAEFLAAAMANASNDSVPAIVPDSDLNHPLVNALGDLVDQWVPLKAVDRSSLSIGRVVLVLLAIGGCIIALSWSSTSSPPRWLVKQDDFDTDSLLNSAPFTGLPAVAEQPRSELKFSQYILENISLRSFGTRILDLFTRPLRVVPTSPQDGDADTPELSPILFSDPALFPLDDPDTVSSFPSRPSDSVATGSSETDSIQVAHPSNGVRTSDPQALSIVLPERCQDAAAPAPEVDCPPTPAPSLDELSPLTASPARARSHSMDESLEDWLTEDLKSTGVVSTLLAGPDSSVSTSETSAQADGDVADEFVTPFMDSEDTYTSPTAISKTTPETSLQGGEDAVDYFAMPLLGNEDMTTSPVAIQTTEADLDEAPKVQPRSIPESATSEVGISPNNDTQRLSVQTEDPKETQAVVTKAEEVLAVIPSSSLLSPGAAVRDVLGEALTAEDWTTIKCFYGMMDDEMNANGQKQMTLVRDCRLPLYYPDPSSPQMPASTSALLEDPRVVPSTPSSESRPQRLRTCTEPHVKTIRKAASDVEPATVLSFAGLKQDVLESGHCSTTASGFIDRFEQALPQIRKQFRSMSSRLGLIPHDRAYIRYVPKAEERHALEVEARALKLATDALEGRRSFKFLMSFPLPRSGDCPAEANQIADDSSRPVEKDPLDSPSVSVMVLGDDSILSQAADVPRTRMRSQTAQLTGDNRVPRWIAPREPTRANRPARSRTLTFQSSAAAGDFDDWETDMLPATHKRAVSEGTLLQEAGARSKKAKMANLKGASRNALLGAQGPRAAKGHAPGTPRAEEPPIKVVLPRPAARRRSSRPPPSIMGTPKLETIIGSPTADTPAKASVEDVPMLSLDEVAARVVSDGGKGKQKARDAN